MTELICQGTMEDSSCGGLALAQPLGVPAEIGPFFVLYYFLRHRHILSCSSMDPAWMGIGKLMLSFGCILLPLCPSHQVAEPPIAAVPAWPPLSSRAQAEAGQGSSALLPFLPDVGEQAQEKPILPVSWYWKQ